MNLFDLFFQNRKLKLMISNQEVYGSNPSSLIIQKIKIKKKCCYTNLTGNPKTS